MTVNIIPYLMMDGNAKEAIQFYEQALGAEVLNFIKYGEMPDLPSTDMKDLVAHARLKIEHSEFMISDSPSTLPVKQGNQVAICISSTDVEKSKKFFDVLVQGGQAKMSFQETSFSPGYGSLTDKFGVTFLIDTEKES